MRTLRSQYLKESWGRDKNLMHCQTCRDSPKYLCPLTHIVRPRLSGRHPDTWMYTPGENKKGFKKTLTLWSQNQKRGLTRVSQREWEKSPEFFFFFFLSSFSPALALWQCHTRTSGNGHGDSSDNWASAQNSEGEEFYPLTSTKNTGKSSLLIFSLCLPTTGLW